MVLLRIGWALKSARAVKHILVKNAAHGLCGSVLAGLRVEHAVTPGAVVETLPVFRDDLPALQEDRQCMPLPPRRGDRCGDGRERNHCSERCDDDEDSVHDARVARPQREHEPDGEPHDDGGEQAVTDRVVRRAAVPVRLSGRCEGLGEARAAGRGGGAGADGGETLAARSAPVADAHTDGLGGPDAAPVEAADLLDRGVAAGNAPGWLRHGLLGWYGGSARFRGDCGSGCRWLRLDTAGAGLVKGAEGVLTLRTVHLASRSSVR